MSTTTTIERRRAVLRLAAEANVHPRTAERALRHGALAIRPLAVRDRVERAAQALGLALGPHDDEGEP